jgi:hypothetical protein
MTEIVVTMVEGEVDPTRVPDLLEAFPAKSVDELPEFILGTMLVRESDSNRWRVVTLWHSMGDLEEYVRSVDTPGAKAAFQTAGVEPSVTVWSADRVLISS